MTLLFRATAACVAILILLAFDTPAVADHHAAQKAVLVTGASTGIGREIAETLAKNGYFVYAGARKQKDLDELNEIDNIQAVRLDVTIQDEIDAAVATVQKEGKALQEVTQLNEWQAYSYSREQLVEKLDAAIKTE